ncbi:MAG: site-specific integrase [Vicinamibacteria bacterium]|nr:site-specific integrase [Vicinamibacteria bacterium]
MGQLRLRGAVWWVRYYRNGVRHEESSGSAKKGDAERLLKLREGDIARGVPITPKVGRLTFDEAAADVVNDYRINGKATLAHVERRVRLHLQPVFGGRRMAAIATSDVRAFAAGRQASGASNGEINRELTLLKRCFSLAMKAGKLLAKPHIPLLDEDNIRTGFFERQEFEDVREHLPEYLRGVFTFAYLTGWRVPSEILTLEWRQVDREAGTVRLDPGTTKNRKGREFPYARMPELVAVVEAQRATTKAAQAKGIVCPHVFHRDGRPIRDYRGAWRTAVEKAGLPGRIPHDFRRTAVRNLVRAGVAEHTAMMLTGHKTRSVFDRYDIVNAADLRDAVSRLAATTGTEKGQSRRSGRVDKIGRSA